MPISSRRCGMITKREAERLVKSFLCDAKPPSLPDDFAFEVAHQCAWGCRGRFLPSRYNSSRAKCVQCVHCQQNFSPNKFIFHSHKLPDSVFSPADAANFNSWRRHIHLASQVINSLLNCRLSDQLLYLKYIDHVPFFELLRWMHGQEEIRHKYFIVQPGFFDWTWIYIQRVE